MPNKKGMTISVPADFIFRLCLKIGKLENARQTLVKKVRGKQCLIRSLHEISEAKGDVNRWFASQRLNHAATDSEALAYYVDNGGAEGFAERIAKEECKKRYNREHPQMMNRRAA
ncbi:MAG: hypothetical protein WCT19_03095 [Candidatus Paceibacterota bacterium]